MPTKNVAQYPQSLWDGTSPTRRPLAFGINRRPDFEDWDQVSAEVIAVQIELDATKVRVTDLETTHSQDAFITVPDASGGSIVLGTPVYMKANGTGAAPADANAVTPQPHVVGFAHEISSGNVHIHVRGTMVLTTGQWDAVVTGGSGGLIPFTEYFLDVTAGKITTTEPTTGGSHVIRMGIAMSTTDMFIHIAYQTSN
jgi:hypothetical protein